MCSRVCIEVVFVFVCVLCVLVLVCVLCVLVFVFVLVFVHILSMCVILQNQLVLSLDYQAHVAEITQR